MNNRRPLLMLFAAIFAAALVAFPAGAHADAGPKTNASCAKIDGRAEDVAYFDTLKEAVDASSDGDTIELIANHEIPKTFSIKKSITLKLNNWQLSTPSGETAAVVLVEGNGTTVTVKDGALRSTSGRVAYVNGLNAKLTLDYVGVSSEASMEPVEVLKGTLELTNSTLRGSYDPVLKIGDSGNAIVNSGTIYGNVKNGCSLTFNGGEVTGSVKNTSKYSSKLAITAGEFQGDVTGDGTYTISGGTFRGDVTNDSNNITVTGGSFKDAALLQSLGSDYSMFYKYANEDTGESACYEVTNEEKSKLKDRSGWLLSLTSDQAIYYEYGMDYSDSKVPVQTDYESLSKVARIKDCRRIYRVTFKDGDEAAEYYGRVFEEEIGDLPKRADTDSKIFKGWYKGSTKADPKTTVSEDVTYEAVWVDAVAQYGDKKYETLQGAIDAATKDNVSATVKLLSDATENVEIHAGADLTLDLNGKTLTGATSKHYAIKLIGARNLTIKNSSSTTGTLSSDGKTLYVEAGSCEVTLKDGIAITSTASSSDAAIWFEGASELASTLNIEGGAYSVTGGNAPALRADTNSTVKITGGTFSSARDETILVRYDAKEVELEGCDVSGHVEIAKDAESAVTIKLGTTFGDFTNRGDLEQGNVLLYKDGKYKVVTADAAKKDAGWVLTDADGVKVYYATDEASKTKADEDLAGLTGATLKALCRVSFYSNGSKVGDVRYIEEGDALGELPDPGTLEGHDFSGWFIGDVKVSPASTVSDPSTEVIAKWTPKSDPQPVTNYKVTFDSKGGTIVDPVEVESGEKVAEPTAPTKTGFDFAGWYLDGTEYNFDAAVTSNITLEAHWNEKVPTTYYMVTFKSDDATYATESVESGKCAWKPETDPAKDNFDFAGWYLGGAEYDFGTAVTGNITLEAHWTEKTDPEPEPKPQPTYYTVTFKSDGDVYATESVESGKCAWKPETDPTKDNFDFAGWYLGGAEYDFGTAVTGNITLEAHWTEKTDPDPDPKPQPVTYCTVTFDSKGGTVIDPVEVKSGEKVAEPAVPTKEGFDFAGWYLGDDEYDFEAAVTDNITLVAHWTEKSDKGDDSGDDSGDKGDKSDDKGGKKDDSGKGNKGSKGDSKQLPATGDPATIISGIAATGAFLAATGTIRRRK